MNTNYLIFSICLNHHQIFKELASINTKRPTLVKSVRRLALNQYRHGTKIGGARRDRTADLLRARQALSQLSYGPQIVKLVGLGGFEPPTSPLSGVRSNHLSYRPNLARSTKPKLSRSKQFRILMQRALSRSPGAREISLSIIEI